MYCIPLYCIFFFPILQSDYFLWIQYIKPVSGNGTYPRLKNKKCVSKSIFNVVFYIADIFTSVDLRNMYKENQFQAFLLFVSFCFVFKAIIIALLDYKSEWSDICLSKV